MIGLGAEAAYEALILHGKEFPSAKEVRDEACRMMQLKVELESCGREHKVFDLATGATCTALEGFLSAKFEEGMCKCMQFRIGELVENRCCSPEWKYGLVEKIVKCPDGSHKLRIRTSGDQTHSVAACRLLHTIVPADLPREILQLAKDSLRREAERDAKAAEVEI